MNPNSRAATLDPRLRGGDGKTRRCSSRLSLSAQLLANPSHGFELAIGVADQPHHNMTGACLCEAIEKFGCAGSRPTITSLPLAEHRGGLSIIAL